MASNPYAAPQADVRDLAVEYQPINMWSPRGRIGRLRYLAYTFAASLIVGSSGMRLERFAPVTASALTFPALT